MKFNAPEFSSTKSNAPKSETPKSGRPAGEGRFAYEGLDRTIHERARLSVLTSLVTHPKGLAFNDLKQLCALTDGNLSRHLKVLEQEKIVEIVRRATSATVP